MILEPKCCVKNMSYRCLVIYDSFAEACVLTVWIVGWLLGCGNHCFLPVVCCLLCIFCSISREGHLWVYRNWCLFILGKCQRSLYDFMFLELLVLLSNPFIYFSLIICYSSFRLSLCSFSMLDAQVLILLILEFLLKLTILWHIDHRTTLNCLVSSMTFIYL